MTTTPNGPSTDDGPPADGTQSSSQEGASGAELGVSEGEGSTFEPEEDAEAPG